MNTINRSIAFTVEKKIEDDRVVVEVDSFFPFDRNLVSEVLDYERLSAIADTEFDDLIPEEDKKKAKEIQKAISMIEMRIRFNSDRSDGVFLVHLGDYEMSRDGLNVLIKGKFEEGTLNEFLEGCRI